MAAKNLQLLLELVLLGRPGRRNGVVPVEAGGTESAAVSARKHSGMLQIGKSGHRRLRRRVSAAQGNEGARARIGHGRRRHQIENCHAFG